MRRDLGRELVCGRGIVSDESEIRHAHRKDHAVKEETAVALDSVAQRLIEERDRLAPARGEDDNLRLQGLAAVQLNRSACPKILDRALFRGDRAGSHEPVEPTRRDSAQKEALGQRRVGNELRRNPQLAPEETRDQPPLQPREGPYRARGARAINAAAVGRQGALGESRIDEPLAVD